MFGLIKNILRITPRTVYLYSLLTGAVTGFAAIAFYYCLSAATHFTYDFLLRQPVPHPRGAASFFSPIVGEPRSWLFFLLPAFGGVLAGWIVYKFAPESEGTGTENFLDSFHNKGGEVRGIVPLIKSIATIFTLSSGGSAGKEGPVAQIGSGIGSIIGKWLKMGARARRTLLLAGAAGGLGAIFQAPLGGALTAIEVLYKEDFESDALIPCIISSVMAYTVFGSFLGFGHLFRVQVETFNHPKQFLFYILLGILCSVTGFLFCKFFHGVKVPFQKLRLPKLLIPAIGGLMAGAIAYFYPQVSGASLGFIQQILDGELGTNWTIQADWQVAARMFLTLAVLKIVATSFTIQSGGSGGVFGPSLFIGAMLGGLVGVVSQHYYPADVPDVTPFIVVGMASFFAGVANAPIASIVMVSELTGGYELLPPLMIVAVIALIFSRHSIYKNQVKNKFHSKAHLWDMNPNVLQKVSVQEAFQDFHQKAILSEFETLEHAKELAGELHESDFVIRNDDGEFVGMVSLKDIHDKPLDTALNLLARKNTSFVYTNQTLYQALERLLEAEVDKIPVVDKIGGKRLLRGYIMQRDILGYYQQTCR